MRIGGYWVLLLSIAWACGPTAKKYVFEPVPCRAGDMPEYDERIGSIVGYDGKSSRDTVIARMKKFRTVFKACRSMTYAAKFYAADGMLITDNKIRITPTGNRWEWQPEIQDEIIIQHLFSPEDEGRADAYKLNKSLDHGPWMRKTVTGIIENEDEIWMHPFRSNQYSFTEVAPFPEINLPLEIGKTWTGGLSIMDGWGDWEHTRGSFAYEVVSREDVEVPYGRVLNAWKIQSTATYPFGTSKLDYWFDDELGFVKKEYENYGGQRLTIVLEEIANQ